MKGFIITLSIFLSAVAVAVFLDIRTFKICEKCSELSQKALDSIDSEISLFAENAFEYWNVNLNFLKLTVNNGELSKIHSDFSDMTVYALEGKYTESKAAARRAVEKLQELK